MYTIGSELIYPEQIKAGDEIVKLYKSNKYSPLLVAEMQQGKTGVVCYVIDKLMQECEAQGFTFKFYVCINISDNDLKNQTEKRIRKANFSPDDVIVLHRNEYKHHPADESIDRTFIIIDECHYALGASSEISDDSEVEGKAEFEDFLNRCGIDYGSPESNWGKPGFWILSVSATPFCHAVVKLRDSKNDKGFQVVRLERDSDYYGLKEMKKDNRLHQSESLIEGKEISNWFKERVKEYLNNSQVGDKRYGHLILRTNGKNKAAIKKYLQDEYQNEIDVQEFSSSKNKKDGRVSPISKVGETISSYRRKPSIVIISGALRAGKTLDRTENIKMWIEPPTSLPDAMLQAVGRVMGRGKFNDKFPIFCNLKSVDDSIQFFNDPEGYVVPEGLNNKPTKTVTKKPIWEVRNITKADMEGKRILHWSGIGTKAKDRQYNAIEKWKNQGTPYQENEKRGGFDYLILDRPEKYESPLREECLNSLEDLKKEYPDIDFDNLEEPAALCWTNLKHSEITLQFDKNLKRTTVLD